jgi:glycosyltransferase involved in cell wall biosynthesis
MFTCSISILTKNEEPNIGACLEAVHSQKLVEKFEVVLVDSGSTDATVQIAKRFPIRIEQIRPEEFHHARTRNFAASLGTGALIVNLSGDAIPASDMWLQELIANFRDPAVGAVYGRQLPKPASGIERQVTYDTIYGEERIVKDPACRAGSGYKFYHFSDVNSALRRNMWESIQYPENFKTFEDLAIAKRILDAGWKIVYEPEALVFHSHHYTPKQLFRRYFDIGYTLKQLGIWQEAGARSSLLRDFGHLLGKQLGLSTNGDRHHGPKMAMSENLAKSTGLLLGVNESFLPLSLKRNLSSYRVYDTPGSQ